MPVPISWAPPSAGDLRHLRFPFRSHFHREGILAAVEEMVAPADVLAKAAVAQDTETPPADADILQAPAESRTGAEVQLLSGGRVP